MRCRRNDVGLLHDDAATAWRTKFAGPNVPKLYANEDEEFDEDVTFDLDVSLFDSIPAVQEAIAMSARDPLSTVLHYDVYVRVILAYLAGLRMCLHCPRCSTEKLNFKFGRTMYEKCKVVPCQNRFGKNARVMGGTFAMAESLAAATEHQGNDTPHIHGIMALSTPY